MAKKNETYKYKIITKYIDTFDIFVEEDEKDKDTMTFRLNNEHSGNFILIGNKMFNKKDIVYIEELKEE